MQQKSRKRQLPFRPLCPVPDLLYLKKQAVFCVPCEQYAHRRKNILRRHIPNCNSFFERWQERTNFSAKSKSLTLSRNESVGLLRGIGEYRLCELTRGGRCLALRPPFCFYLTRHHQNINPFRQRWQERSQKQQIRSPIPKKWNV